MDDQQLLGRYIDARDQEAFAALVRRHAKWVFAAAYRQLKDRQLAEDAVQVVFILLAQKAAAMNRQKLSGWLFNTLRYTVRNIRRAGKRRSVHEQAAAFRDKDDPPPSPERVKELAEVMDDAVARLPVKYREAVLLRFYEGLGFEELAGALAITEAAARKRIERAIEMLRGHVGADVGATLMSSTAMVGVEMLGNGGAAGGAAGGIGSAAGGGFIQSTIQTALAAKGAGAAPATLAATVKGVGAMMTMGKVQAAVLATVAIMGVGVPMTLVGIEVATQARASDGAGGAATGPAAKSDEERLTAEFNREYGLDIDEVLKWVPPPLPTSREPWWRMKHMSPTAPGGNVQALAGASAADAPMTGQVFITPQGNGGAALPGTIPLGGGGATATTGRGGAARVDVASTAPSILFLNWNDNGPIGVRDAWWGTSTAQIKSLISTLVQIDEDQIEIPKELMPWAIRGDWVVRSDAKPDRVLAALTTFLKQDRDVPITLGFKDVDRPFYVLSGKWKYTHPEGVPAPTELGRARRPTVDGRVLDTVEVFGGERFDPASRITGSGTGSAIEAFSKSLSRWIGQPVVIEAENVPDNIGWRTYSPAGGPTNGDAQQAAHDPQKVLEHVAAQTGLKMTHETRKVRRIVMEMQLP